MLYITKSYFKLLGVSFVILFTIAFSLQQYFILHRSDIITAYKQDIVQKISQNHGPLNGANVDLISSWMTFDYINTIFVLPADYLKNTLGLSDARYPRITIAHYEKNHTLSDAEFLLQIKATVKAYFSH